jgi:ubiquinone/menaquinone biosynthesis C-methylase UbiE
MDHHEVGQLWNENAKVWAPLARQGYDVYRDFLNTPAFLAMLPEVSGLQGLDIGCGEAENTRQLARRRARMTGLDIAEVFLGYALETERQQPLGIRFVQASGQELPFPDRTFDFATACMSLMDMPEPLRAMREAFRVLRPGGFFQFSITHPCFMTSRWQWIRDEWGKRIGVVCGDYFEPPENLVDEWVFSAVPEPKRSSLPKFRVPRFFLTLSEWVNGLLEAGFVLERLEEPSADEETVRRCPRVADTRLVAYFLHVRCRKPRSP